MRREFQLSDSFDFVKAGVEAIIEDQVTSRFEAEELKVRKEKFVENNCSEIDTMIAIVTTCYVNVKNSLDKNVWF